MGNGTGRGAPGAAPPDPLPGPSGASSSIAGQADGNVPWEGTAYFPPDSTRFFRPASARSMMTFSALRLIMPSMGILTSTVSW